ncbi:MAG: SoxR reducing system RseC family protein [Gammaproteobacteria bacterium]|nr:SoxR reducing system RseC family protein [Gammaproteobacteria bacterium]
MLEEHATVVSVDEDGIWVEVQRRSVCGQCAANKGCGSAVLQKVLGNKRNIFRVSGDFPVNVGDEVIIGVNENALVKGSLLVYAVPVLYMIVFALLGETIVSRTLSIESDSMSVLGALVGLVVSVMGLRWHSRKTTDHPQYQPILLRHANEVLVQPEYKLLG